MARYPEAQWRPLASDGGACEGTMARYDIICLHTMAGYLDGTDSMFHEDGYGGTESHFGVGGQYDKSGQDGLVYQWVDTKYRADANLNGNHRVISIETSDGNKSGPPPWSDAQMQSLAKLIKWISVTHNIPLTLIPDSKSNRRGVGYHRQGINPWRVPDGELWSNAYSKVCPGDARIAQVPKLIEMAGGAPAPITPPPSGGGSSSSGTFTLSFDGGGSMTLRMVKKVSPYMTGTDIKSWQRLLADRGYSPGSIDGAWGDKSDSALRNFQKAKGLSSDGVLGPASGERILEG